MKLSELKEMFGLRENIGDTHSGGKHFSLYGFTTVENLHAGVAAWSTGFGKTTASAKKAFCENIQGKWVRFESRGERMIVLLPLKITPR